jgi:Fibronectin type III domain
MPSQSSTSRTATVSWEAPTTNTDGTPLTDLVGYRICYGSSPEDLSHSVQINTVGLQTYVIDGLEPGTWYFAVRAVAADGSESPSSDIAAKTIA